MNVNTSLQYLTRFIVSHCNNLNTVTIIETNIIANDVAHFPTKHAIKHLHPILVLISCRSLELDASKILITLLDQTICRCLTCQEHALRFVLLKLIQETHIITDYCHTEKGQVTHSCNDYSILE